MKNKAKQMRRKYFLRRNCKKKDLDLGRDKNIHTQTESGILNPVKIYLGRQRIIDSDRESVVNLKSLVGKFLIYEKVKSRRLEGKLFEIATDSCDIDVFFYPYERNSFWL